MMTLRGIRGAITITADDKAKVLSATQELLESILESNPDLHTEDIASAMFTVTDDITSVHPALAARQLGWNQVAMMCAREIPVLESMAMCIRVLIHWNTEKSQSAIRHVYLREAVNLRPDIATDA